MLNAVALWLSQFLKDHPVVMPLALVVPLALLAFLRKTYPSRTLVALAALPCVLTAGVLMRQDWIAVLLALDLALILVMAYDAWTPAGPGDFTVHREAPRIASLRKTHTVSLQIINRLPRDQELVVRDDLPPSFDAEPAELPLTLPPRSRLMTHYDLTPTVRGEFQMGSIHLRTRSRLGLWHRYLRLPEPSTVRVYPDLKQLGEYALLARTNRLSLMGLRRTRRVGQDNDFERLRDYTTDDNYKHIDWRSTARRSKLTVKDFQATQSQRIIFLLDCGRMMTNHASGLSLLDHAFNSMLMLSHIALSRGDAVGLVTFSDGIHTSVPARGGRTQMNHLLHAVFDRFPTLVESRYEEAFLHLSSRFRKRSLVVLFTNIVDEVNARQVQQYLGHIGRRHLPLLVLLRDHQMYAPLADPTPEGSSLYRAAAAAEVLTWRQQVLTDLTHQGVLVLDQFPERMTAPLINQYLEIKARHLL